MNKKCLIYRTKISKKYLSLSIYFMTDLKVDVGLHVMAIRFIAATSERYNSVSAAVAVTFQIAQVAHHT